MSLTITKLIFAIAIFIIGFSSGLLPFKLIKRQERLLSLGDAFASGVFLSAGLIHMLPNAMHNFHSILGQNSYPIAPLICVIVFVILLLIERQALTFCKERMQRCATPYILALVLSIHSIIAGAALGMNASIAGALIIFLAIIAHKGSAGFALATNLHRYNLPANTITKVILIFALSTPLGILVASGAETVLHANSGYLAEAIFNACAAGTFLYLGTVHTMIEPRALERYPEAFALIVGVAIMAIVAIWL